MTNLFRPSAIALLLSLSLGGCVSSQYQAPKQLTAEQPLPATYQLVATPACWLPVPTSNVMPHCKVMRLTMICRR